MLTGLRRPEARDFDAAVARMFESEWRLQRKEGTPRRIAIVDDSPEEHTFTPNFSRAALPRQARHGSGDRDAGKLRFERARCSSTASRSISSTPAGRFCARAPRTRGIARGLSRGAVVSRRTACPRALRRQAQPRLLSDPTPLRLGGVSAETLADLSAVPRTVLVTPENAQELWRDRKKLFFSLPRATAARQSTAATA